MEIRNNLNELLDVSIDGVEIGDAKVIIVYNHGFGTDRHERGLTDDIVTYLRPNQQGMAIIRLSYSGYGESEGEQEDKTLDTMADDLVSVWKYVNNNKSDGAKVITISFSMGNQVLTKALAKYPFIINKMICISPANFVSGEEGKEKWSSRPGVTYDGDIMSIPRADGSITKISQIFWDSLDPNSYKKNLSEAAKKYESVLIRGTEDDIVDNTKLIKLPFTKIYEISGNHNYSNKEDRAGFLRTLAGIIV